MTANEMANEVRRSPQVPANGALGVFADITTFGNAQRMAQCLASSTIVPKEYQNNVGNCMIALEMASRINTSPMMVMQNLYIVNGRPAWSSQWIIAMINSSRRYKTELQFEFGHDIEDGGLSCMAWAEDYNGHKVCGPKVTMNMANSEGWTTKSGSKWKTMPEVMIQYRAASFFGRMNCPNMIMGIYSSDEVIDMEGGDLGEELIMGIAPGMEEIAALQSSEQRRGSAEANGDEKISQEQRKTLFKLAKQYLGEEGNDAVATLLEEQGYSSTEGLPVSVFNVVMGRIMDIAEDIKRYAGSDADTSNEAPSEETGS